MNIAVFGAGYVGLVTAVCLAAQGNKVTVVEKDRDKLEKLQEGRVTFYEPDVDSLLDAAMSSGQITFTSDSAAAIAPAELLFICVGTPALPDGSADLSQVEAVMRTILKHLSHYQIPSLQQEAEGKLVVVKSTVPVGTGDRLSRMAELHMQSIGAAVPIEVASNPEFLREGAAVHDFLFPDRIVIGVGSARGERLLRELYRSFECPVLSTDTRTAEMIKYASNSFLATKISFINMVSDLCDKVQADVTHVAKGMGYDRRIGEQFLKAGIGFGGSCFPKDLQAFAAVGRKHHVQVELLEQVIRINQERPVKLLEKLKDALWVMKGKRVTVLGLTFKPHTDDVRDCPASHVIAGLLREQAEVVAYDPVGMANFRAAYPELSARMRFADNAYEACDRSDGIVLLTEWPLFKELDWVRVLAKMETPYLLDARHYLIDEELGKLGFVCN
ncbi:UDP-glucose/GDP-mannose dehydrogenase family protein [Paenibacillus sp. PL2-23]|uniref:UDP-glucose dehydrogenase family protein n=1 Tax=Paenibacillus sp. PL2-23 TaxID=2100729 RepID=UPI0030F607B3